MNEKCSNVEKTTKCYGSTKTFSVGFFIDKLTPAVAACDGVLENSLNDRAVIGHTARHGRGLKSRQPNHNLRHSI